MIGAKQQSAGFALVLVLWILSILTIMAGSFALNMRRETTIIAGVKNNAQTNALAESGLAIAELMLLSPDKIKRWRTDGSIYQINFAESDSKPGGSVRIRLMSESGKIDINKADQKLLAALLASLPIQIDEKTQNGLVGAIMDWRDEDDLIHIDGAESKEYKDAGLDYLPRNQAFQTVEELQMVLGMDETIFASLEPLVTIYGQAHISPQHASKDALLTLPEADKNVIQEYVFNRFESAVKGLPPPPFPLKSLQQTNNDQHEILSIISEATTDNGNSSAISAIVKKSADVQNSPFDILKWQRNFAPHESLFAESLGTSPMSELLIKEYAEFEFNR